MGPTLEKKAFRFPNTVTLLACIVVLVTILTYIVPAGTFDRAVDEVTGRTLVVPGTYSVIESTPVSFMFMMSSFYRGVVDAASLMAFVFTCGGAFGIITRTGAITAGLNRLIVRFNGRETWLIAIVMTAFCIGGMSYGMAEETIPFVAIMIPIAIKMGFDPVVGVAMIIIATYSGYSPGPLNPFNTGVAQEICQLPTFSGIGLRVIMAVGALLIAIQHVTGYGKKYKKQVNEGRLAPDYELSFKEAGEERPMNAVDKLVLAILACTMAVLIIGVMKFDWYFTEMSALFTIMAVVVGMIYFKGDFDATMSEFVAGAKSLAGTVLIVSMSRAILVVMQQGQIMDTIVQYLSAPLASLHSVFAAWGMYLIQGVINFLIPSSSGQAVAVMPIMSAVADLIGVTRQTAVLAFQCGDGFWNMITPMHPTTMACIGIAGISFGKWFKFALPLVIKWSAWVLLILTVAVLTGYGPF